MYYLILFLAIGVIFSPREIFFARSIFWNPNGRGNICKRYGRNIQVICPCKSVPKSLATVQESIRRVMDTKWGFISHNRGCWLLILTSQASCEARLSFVQSL